MKVAVVCNSDHTGVINHFGAPCPEKYARTAIQSTVQALEAAGHEVLLCEADKNVLANLEEFMPADAAGRPTGIVFNMAYGIQGQARYTHLPAVLEMAGVPYTGSTPLGHALALDKVITKKLMADAGVPTPRYRVMRCGSESPDGLRFPLVVKPRQESTSFGLQLVHDPGQLAVAVEAVRASYQQDALVEEYIEGREICVGLLGNETLQFLPFVEHEFGAAAVRMLTWEAKTGKLAADVRKICPAPVSEALAAGLRAISEATFRACWCRDYARVDIRIDVNGAPYVLEINSMASLGSTGSFVLAATAAGYSVDELVNRILDIAHSRYFGGPAPRRLDETYIPPQPQHVLLGRHLHEAAAGEARSPVPSYRNAR